MDYPYSAYLIFEVPKFSFKLKESLRGEKKLYVIDTGIANAVLPMVSDNIGRPMENFVFLELLRKKHYLRMNIKSQRLSGTRLRD
ncbi:DUF4143 domain-containing protein [Thermococcus sp.]